MKDISRFGSTPNQEIAWCVEAVWLNPRELLIFRIHGDKNETLRIDIGDSSEKWDIKFYVANVSCI